MRLDWVVACRYAEATQEGTITIVGGGVDTGWVPGDFPAGVGVVLAMRIMAREHELSQPHEMTIRLLGPEMEEIGVLNAQFQAGGVHPLHQPGWEAASPLVVPVQFEATRPGTYSFEISLDARHAKTVPYNVREGTPFDAQAAGQPEPPDDPS